MRTRVTLAIALTASFSSAALAQRALRSKDAPAPLPDEPPPDSIDAGPAPSPAPSSRLAPTPSAAPTQQQPQPSRRKNSKAKVAGPPDAGPALPPTFKDDLTPEEIARANTTAAALDCSSGPCEALVRKRLARREWVLHIRPAQPRLGEVAEVVIDLSELLETPDPELGDKKPLEGLQLTGHLEGVGRYELHSVDGSAGSYGFHFTPQVKGARKLVIEATEASGGSNGPTAEFEIAIGQPPAKGVEIRPYEPRFTDAVGWTMAELGSAWGGLWGVALGTGHGDAAALEATVQRLSKAGLDEIPGRAANDRTAYVALARSFSQAADHLVGVKAGGLPAALNAMEQQQCERCHVAYAWGLASDVSSWPQVTIGKKEEE
jgi:hypothetical protein